MSTPQMATRPRIALAAVEEQAVLSVVCGEKVEPTVAVHVRGTGANGTIRRIVRRATAPCDAAIGGDVREMAAVIAVQRVGVAVHVGEVQIEVAVFVGVEPDGADAFALVRQPDFRRDICKLAGVVAKQRVRAIAKRHEQVDVAVRIEVDPRELPHGSRVSGHT